MYCGCTYALCLDIITTPALSPSTYKNEQGVWNSLTAVKLEGKESLVPLLSQASFGVPWSICAIHPGSILSVFL